MKQALMLIVCSWVLNAAAQAPVLKITTDKTSSLLFPFPVQHVDLGTAAILVQQVPLAEHILLVKAARAFFPETNMSVVTRDGQLYSFRVCYEKDLQEWVHQIPSAGKKSPDLQAAQLIDYPPTVRGLRDRNWDMTARVKGTFYKDDLLYLQLEITNKGPVDYDIEYLRFHLRDRKKVKRTAMQELEQKEQHIAGYTSRIGAGSSETMVVALPKLTIPQGQYLDIHLGEQGGGRHLRIKVGNGPLLRALRL